MSPVPNPGKEDLADPHAVTRRLLFKLQKPSSTWGGGQLVSVSQPCTARCQMLPVLLGKGDVGVAPTALDPEELIAVGNLVGIDTLGLEGHLILLIVAGSDGLVNEADEDGNGILGQTGSAVSTTHNKLSAMYHHEGVNKTCRDPRPWTG